MRKVSLLLCLILAGCSCPKQVEVVERVEYRDSVAYVTLPPDTSAVEALLKCSEKGEVLLSALNEQTARNTKMQTTIDSLGRLRVKVIKLVDSIPVVQHDTIEIKQETMTKIVEVERPLTWWQKTLQGLGVVLLAGIVLILVTLRFHDNIK